MHLRGRPAEHPGGRGHPAADLPPFLVHGARPGSGIRFLLEHVFPLAQAPYRESVAVLPRRLRPHGPVEQRVPGAHGPLLLRRGRAAVFGFQPTPRRRRTRPPGRRRAAAVTRHGRELSATTPARGGPTAIPPGHRPGGGCTRHRPRPGRLGGMKESLSMHIFMVTLGTRGDLEPFAILGTELRERGHRVVIGTSEDG